MHRIRQILIGLDRTIYRFERALLLVALIMMTALVFSDVIIRTFTRPVGKTASLLLWLLEKADGGTVETRQQIIDYIGPIVFFMLALCACVFAAHASRQIRSQREETESPALLGSALRGILVFAALSAVVQTVVYFFPTGIAGAQKFALGFMVWAGFLGASLATRARRHIMIDAVKKKLDNVSFPIFAFIGSLLTAGFTGWVAFLAAFKSAILIQEWHESDGRLHVFESLPVPEWVVTIALPTTLMLSALRFLAYGTGELLWGRSFAVETDVHGIKLDDLANDDDRSSAHELAPEAVVEGPVYGTPHRGTDGRLTAEGRRL